MRGNISGRCTPLHLGQRGNKKRAWRGLDDNRVPTVKGTGAKVLFGLLEGVCFLNKNKPGQETWSVCVREKDTAAPRSAFSLLALLIPPICPAWPQPGSVPVAAPLAGRSLGTAPLPLPGNLS